MCVFVAKGGLAIASVVRNGVVGVRDEPSQVKKMCFLVQVECLVSPSPALVLDATRSCCFRGLSTQHSDPKYQDILYIKNESKRS